MNVLSSNITRAQPFLFSAKRSLGNQARGPSALTDIQGHLREAKAFFRSENALSYNEFKQQCESLRLFVFTGVAGILTMDLFLRPVQSTYWKRISPHRVLANVSHIFFAQPGSVLLSEKRKNLVNCPELHKQLCP
eukprot:Selendium_serpulae@DN6328_c0_g2_i10.p3